MRAIDADALKAEITLMFGDNTHITESVCDLIDNAPTVEPRIEYGTDGQPYRLFMSGDQVTPDMLQGWKYEERPFGRLI